MSKLKLQDKSTKFLTDSLLTFATNQINLLKTEKQEGRSSSLGDSTAAKAVNLSMNRKVTELEKTRKAIETIYQGLCQDKQAVMEEYWQSRYTTAGLSYKLGVDERTIRRWKQYIVYCVAAELNYL